ncbi:MAG: hypothetical protein KDI44_16580 [Thiothrix sp.]|nr:hypothetical protein [Thiothrix sp.]HPQ96610.1 hypothetical protein [Thiolinea sp.]
MTVPNHTANITALKAVPASNPNRPLYVLRDDAAPEAVASRQYQLARHMETLLEQVEGMTGRRKDIDEYFNTIGWMLDILTDLNRQQAELAEYLNSPKWIKGVAA